jgi:hypothetical protein
MSTAMQYSVRVLYRFLGSEKDRSEVIRVTAKDTREAQSQARMVWLDNKPEGQGVQFLGCVAEPDAGQMSLL